jgi:RNA polymerase sigma-70 factor (sigma-E family)
METVLPVIRGKIMAARDDELAHLFDEHYDALRRLAFILVRDPAMAEEVAMEAFARVLTVWGRVRELEVPHLYLRRIVVNLCRSRWKRLQLEWRANRLHEARAQGLEGVSAAHIDLWDAVGGLPMIQKCCVVLRYLEDLPEAQIAAVLEIPLGTVKTHLHRARQRLRAELEER